jgi:hypothetical protein
MFLLSLMAVPVNAGAGDHKVILIPAIGSENADQIKLFEGSTQVGERSTVSGTTYFYLAHGDYKAEAYQSGVKKAEVSFTVSDTSNPAVTYAINAISVPAKPTNVVATAVSTTEVKLSWNYPSTAPAVDSFKLSRGGTEIATIGALDRAYSNTGLAPNTTYNYIITAVNTAGSTASDAVSVTTPQDATQVGDIIVRDLNFKDEVAPGASVEFELELQNNGTYDAEDIIATIVIHEIAADKDNLETDIDFGLIDAKGESGDKKTESVDIVIPQDADDKLYTVSVDLAWKDANGNKYTGTYTSPDKMEVVKQKHQISITSVQEDATKYIPGSTVQIAVNLLNTGANAETVTIKATSEVGATATSASFKLKEGDASTQYLSFAVPENTKAGKYFVVITAVYGSYTATKSIVLEVASTTAPTIVSVVTPDNEIQGGNGTGIPVTEIALAVIIILLIGAIGWMAKDIIAGPRATKPIAVSRSRVFK